MKLSKQERIGVLIIAVVLILVLGVIFFVVPKFKEVKSSKLLLDSKKTEYQAALDKAATKDDLRKQIEDAYKAGRNSADMFFEEMTPYELDNEVRAFIKKCQDDGINVAVEELAVGEAGVEALSVSFFDESKGAEYDLKSYANQGETPSAEELLSEARRLILMTRLSAVQNVAASKASFTVSVLTRDDYIKFVDAVNNYEKEENGKKTRKAMIINGLSLEYTEIIDEYDAIIEEMNATLDKDAQDALEEYAEKNDFKAATKDDKAPANGTGDENNNNNNTQPGAEDEDDEEEGKRISDLLQPYTVSITFYCVERMQDPKDILDAQDAA
ncbi:MAG: hypothetical protein ACI4KA_05350 [Oscillospiraceae bacterium]